MSKHVVQETKQTDTGKQTDKKRQTNTDKPEKTIQSVRQTITQIKSKSICPSTQLNPSIHALLLLNC